MLYALFMKEDMRNIDFQNSEYYHIFNRGVDKRDIFCDDKDFTRFIICLREFNNIKPIGSLHVQKELNSFAKEFSSLPEKLVNIACYALIKNHYHFILQQSIDNGIPKFMQKISTGYTNYFNFKYNRSGSLFQGTYKAIPIESTSQLEGLSSHINGNPEIHKIAKAENYLWSSYQDYLGKRNGTLCNKEIVLNEFNDINDYKIFTNNFIKESQTTKSEIKKYFLE